MFRYRALGVREKVFGLMPFGRYRIVENVTRTVTHPSRHLDLVLPPSLCTANMNVNFNNGMFTEVHRDYVRASPLLIILQT